MSFYTIISKIEKVACRLGIIETKIAPIEITYAELKNLTNISELTPNQKYLITDFQTLHIIANTTDRNDANTVIPIEPLILTAVTKNKFHSKAISTTYPKDIIIYDIDNSAWGTLVHSSSKGRITKRTETSINLTLDLDFRGEVVRRWAVDMTTFTGVAKEYILPNTTFSTGKAYNSSSGAANSLVAISAGDYQDSFVVDLTKSIFNVSITRIDNTTNAFNNYVFKGNITNVNFSFLLNSTFLGNVSRVSSLTSYNNIVTTEINKINSVQFVNAFIGITMGWSGDIKGVFVDNTIMPHPNNYGSSAAVHCNFTNIWGNSLLCKSSVPNQDMAIELSRAATGNVKSASMTISSQSESDMAIIRNINERSLLGGWVAYSWDSQTVDSIKYIDGVISNLEYEVAAAATLANSNAYANPSIFCGVYNVTGSGTVNVTAIGTNASVINQARTPILLKPVSGLIIQLTNNDVDFGIITNGQTYEANGTNSETIRLEWVNDRYYVTSGRVL